ncbi:GGDEF domain-containing protein [Methylomonas sp. LW13]|uniref:diguanylate cyclase n=1 Tax=Methylomonas defluvii TaxID=3045149 RepID=A0ABU4ULF3_9GAMM|nr:MULTISPECIES: GGDEF domain-containing protein [unclassified Methylomonas]MDX8130339.1 diguanylate cyclase [Methylomonas sp. OY6]PKD42244.1 GGDEF domain-containing protein [Methylomonas sp. Kb3]QBC25747.1 GGDEF domain-containing protein [Methylomonas sp. LW13]
MVFFKNKDEGPDRWKEKYLKLLDDQEHTEKQYKANEELLCKTIVRFALAVKGLNRQLDPHLNRIRNLLKSGLQSQQLQKELSAFSNALIMLEESPEPSLMDASLLFEFLGKQYPQHSDQLDEIREKYENRLFSNNQAFYLALLELIEGNKPLANMDLALELTGADAKAINIQLVRLLDNAEIPLVFAEDAEKIKNRLHADQALGPIFDDTVALLLAIKKHLESEQQEMAAFLSKLTEQLTELGVKATGVNAANEIRVKKRNLLDQAVSEQIMELREKSENATQLEPLKQIVSSRLTTITQQIQAHNLQEQQERDKTQRDMQILSQRLREMESESSELRSKLDLAQHRATRDPLTNLPNRLAFEDRLADEMARCRRHKSPMTLMVWDVDLFKSINDTYGHKSGDKALIVIAELLLKHCRETDFVARFGGEEFVMILPGADAKSALVIAEKLRKTLENSSFNANGNKVSITLSCGMSQFIDGDTNESIFNRADSGLYRAKQTGRNRCVVV